MRSRRFAAAGLAVLGAVILGGCKAQHQASLDGSAALSSVSAIKPAPALSATSVSNVKSGKAQAAPAAVVNVAPGEKPSVASVALAFAPMPVPRPDFGDRPKITAAPNLVSAPQAKNGSAMPPATSAAQPANPPPAVAAANLSREDKPAAPVRVVSARKSDNSFLSEMFSEPRRPPGFEEANDPEPPLSATEERLERSRTSEDGTHANVVPAAANPASAPASPVAAAAGAGPVIVTTAARAPASIAVNGVTKTLPSPAGPHGGRTALAQPSRTYTHESIPGQAAGRYWKSAHPHVVTHCFDSTLRNALNVIGLHFRRTVLVTSGHRTRGRRRSMHRFCRAADIRVPGIRPSRVARFARGIPGINGIGTYRRKAIVHIDTRLQQMVWRY